MCLLCACRQRCYCGRLLLSVASGYDEQDGPDSVKLQLDPEELCVLRAGVHWPEGQDHGAQYTSGKKEAVYLKPIQRTILKMLLLHGAN